MSMLPDVLAELDALPDRVPVSSSIHVEQAFHDPDVPRPQAVREADVDQWRHGFSLS